MTINTNDKKLIKAKILIKQILHLNQQKYKVINNVNWQQ